MYCDMNRTCGNLIGGWMRVANIDMTNTSQQCPTGLTLISSPKRLCDLTWTGSPNCISKTFINQGIEYSHVCDRVIGYQKRLPLAFYRNSRNGLYNDFDGYYVYGVSLTHGQNPRKHIWTFAGASDESTHDYYYKCPCTNTALSLFRPYSKLHWKRLLLQHRPQRPL